MRLFIDCEWNGWRGDLLSMALVPQDRRLQEFYVELELPHGRKLTQWVRDHVAPFLTREPVPMRIAQASLAEYLSHFSKVTIVADWPEDIAWFCSMLITGPGERIGVAMPLTMEVIPMNATSRIPHNALEDARGNRDAWIRSRV
jgi:hypothetical protein